MYYSFFLWGGSSGTLCIQSSKTKSIFRNKCKQKGQASGEGASSGEGSSSAGNAEINKVISIVGR
jgi:hypothetical protein